MQPLFSGVAARLGAFVITLSMLALVPLGLLQAACSIEGPAPTVVERNAIAVPEVDASSDTQAPELGSGESPNGVLKIVSLTSTSATVTGGSPTSTESESVTFVAIVTDSKGLDTIAGGQLVDDTGATYGAFGAGANKGTYAAAITFSQINQVRAIEFGTPGTGHRQLLAKFFDNEGNTATAGLDIALACRHGGELVGVCGGKCTSTSADGDHCGNCSAPCSASRRCHDGACEAIGLFKWEGLPSPSAPVAATECLPIASMSSTATCAAICTIGGHGCVRAVVSSSNDCSSPSEAGECNTPLTTFLARGHAKFACACR